MVTPLAGVWIEMFTSLTPAASCSWSLPLRECGLKFNEEICPASAASVTPLAGVWIEIEAPGRSRKGKYVTPLAGVWIEMRRCCSAIRRGCVTPLAGVWIEIPVCDVV